MVKGNKFSFVTEYINKLMEINYLIYCTSATTFVEIFVYFLPHFHFAIKKETRFVKNYSII